jgi:hypothetical protein
MKKDAGSPGRNFPLSFCKQDKMREGKAEKGLAASF